jgi:hypothetical protein
MCVIEQRQGLGFLACMELSKAHFFLTLLALQPSVEEEEIRCTILEWLNDLDTCKIPVRPQLKYRVGSSSCSATMI